MASLRQIAFRTIGTVALAAGFVWLVSRSPFFPQTLPSDASQRAVAAEASHLVLPKLDANTGIIPPEAFAVLETIQQQQGFQPSMGLLRAEFAQTADSPGFINEERIVAGECEGAGRRYVEASCPDCAVSESAGEDGMPPVIMWTQWGGPVSRISAVTRDCVAIAADDGAVVSLLELGGDHIDLDGELRNAELDIVPLVPGARRAAVIEMGGWVAVFDTGGRASTALRDMLGLLTEAGWRDAPSLSDEPWPFFEGQRVVVNDRGQYAVVAMNRHDNTYQLVTIVTSRAGG